MDYHKLSDRELETLLVGNCPPEEVVEVYLGRHLGGLARMARSIYGVEKADVEDMVGATMVTFCEKLHSLKPGYLKRWLYQALIYQCLNYRRKRIKLYKTEKDLKTLGFGHPADGHERSLIWLDVTTAMEKFHAKDRGILYNLIVEEKTCGELAEAAGVTTRTMETKKANLLRRLRMNLKDKEMKE